MDASNVAESTNCLPNENAPNKSSDLSTSVDMNISLDASESCSEKEQSSITDEAGSLKTPPVNEQVTVKLNTDGGNEVWIKPKSFSEGNGERRELGAFYNDSPSAEGHTGPSVYRLNDPCRADDEGSTMDYLLQSVESTCNKDTVHMKEDTENNIALDSSHDQPEHVNAVAKTEVTESARQTGTPVDVVAQEGNSGTEPNVEEVDLKTDNCPQPLSDDQGGKTPAPEEEEIEVICDVKTVEDPEGTKITRKGDAQSSESEGKESDTCETSPKITPSVVTSPETVKASEPTVSPEQRDSMPQNSVSGEACSSARAVSRRTAWGRAPQ